MKNAIILHGRPSKEEYYSAEYPSCSNSHWLPWLQKQLLIRDILAQTPEMPSPYMPDYPLWQKEFERYEITPETMLVGHSSGGAFIVRWLSEHPDTKVGKVVLIAPSLGLDRDNMGFFKFTIDPALVQRTTGLTIFGSDDDYPVIVEAVARYRSVLRDAEYHEFTGYGHFVFERMRTDKFPELLEQLI